MRGRKCACGEKATRSFLEREKVWEQENVDKSRWNRVLVRSFCETCWHKLQKVIHG